MTMAMLRRRIGAVVERAREDPPLALLCLIVLTLPLEFLRPWFPSGSLDVARIGMIAGVAWLGWQTGRDRGSLRRPPRALLVAAAAIIVVEAVSFALTRWPGASKSLLAVGAYAAFAIFVVNSVRSRGALTILAGALVLAGALEGIVIVIEQVADFHLFRDYPAVWLDRRSGTFWDPNLAARMLLVTLTAALGIELIGESVSGRRRAILLGAIALMTYALVLTLSRTGFLLLGLVVAVALVVSLRRRAGRIAPLVVVATFAVGLALNPLAYKRAGDLPPPDPGIAPAPGTPTSHTTTALDSILAALPIDGTRRYLVRAGIAMFEENPIAGVGLGGFQPMILGPYRALVPIAPGTPFISLEHTDVVRVAAEEGLIGLAAWALLLAAIILTARTAMKRGGPVERAAVAVLVSATLLIAAASQTEGRYYSDPYLWLAIGMLAAIAIRGPAWTPNRDASRAGP